MGVFTGTSSGLADFEIQSDYGLQLEAGSRGLEIHPRTYYPKGDQNFPPFVNMTTIGCRLQHHENQSKMYNTEYENAIVYGRPLFSIMKEKGDLDKHLESILRRMVLRKSKEDDVSDWSQDLEACLSISATRVQMGMASVAVVSDLVAKGYANLIGIAADNLANFAYLLDPVCAPV